MTFLSRLYARWFPDPHMKRGPNKVPPDEERCTSPTDKGDRCKFRRAAGERCSIHQKIYEKTNEEAVTRILEGQ